MPVARWQLDLRAPKGWSAKRLSLNVDQIHPCVTVQRMSWLLSTGSLATNACVYSASVNWTTHSEAATLSTNPCPGYIRYVLKTSPRTTAASTHASTTLGLVPTRRLLSWSWPVGNHIDNNNIYRYRYVYLMRAIKSTWRFSDQYLDMRRRPRHCRFAAHRDGDSMSTRLADSGSLVV